MPSASGSFDGDRLVLARQLRGMRKIELAEQAHVSPAAISQYENQAMQPKPEALIGLAFALSLPVSFFSRRAPAPRVNEHEYHFRRLRSSRKIDRSRILARTALLSELVSVLETRLQLPTVDLPSELSLRTDGEPIDQQIEATADALRERWQLGRGPISNMVRLLESRGCIVTRQPSDTQSVDAFSGWWNRRPYVVLSSDKGDAARSRFDAAHELGHLVLHPDADPTNRGQEIEAHAFASAFLLPRHSLSRELPAGLNWDAYLALKARWRVSLQALLRRARHVGRLSDAQFRRAMTAVSARGWRTREPGDAGSLEQPSVLARALEVAARDGGLTRNALAEHLHLGLDDLEALFDDLIGRAA